MSRPLVLCLWPGLAQLWIRGAWSACAESFAFAAALNLLLIATAIWPNWLPAWQVRLGWMLMLAFWIGGFIQSYRKLPKWLSPSHSLVKSDLLPLAQVEYLRGNWFEAEGLLHRHLIEHSQDAESILLLVGVLRRTRRYQQALQWLSQLEKLEGADRWQLEIVAEKKQILARREAEGGESSSESPEGEEIDSDAIQRESGQSVTSRSVAAVG